MTKMCIRDRVNNALLEMKENFRRWDSMGDKLVEIIDVVSEKAGTSGTVSYTHLDVYKRQMLY